MDRTLIAGCCIAGLGVFFAGVGTYWKFLRSTSMIEALFRIAPVLLAAPLATFAMEHLLDAADLSQLVPKWIPFHLFWTYVVGVGLISSALSFVMRRQMRWAALLLAIQFGVFVLTIHVPNVLANRTSRLLWSVLLRDLLFFAGSGALAANLWRGNSSSRIPDVFRRTAQVLCAVALLVFAVQHFLYPKFAPGVPLPKMTPAWVPLPSLWAYLTGGIFMVAGVGLLISRGVRLAAAVAGGTLVLLTLFLYLPILLLEFGSPNTLEGINYVADTLLAASAVLLCGLGRNSLEPLRNPEPRNIDGRKPVHVEKDAKS